MIRKITLVILILLLGIGVVQATTYGPNFLPTMTSNTTPSGNVTSSSSLISPSLYPAWQAFDGVFSNFIRTTIVDRIIEDLGTQLTSDKDHIRFMDSLWDKSKRNGRTEADKARIITAYLARAKSLIPSLRSKYVSEALGQKTRIASGKKEKTEEIASRTNSGTSGRGSNGANKNYNPKSINYSKTSDADILNDNITYK